MPRPLLTNFDSKQNLTPVVINEKKKEDKSFAKTTVTIKIESPRIRAAPLYSFMYLHITLQSCHETTFHSHARNRGTGAHQSQQSTRCWALLPNNTAHKPIFAGRRPNDRRRSYETCISRAHQLHQRVQASKRRKHKTKSAHPRKQPPRKHGARLYIITHLENEANVHRGRNKHYLKSEYTQKKKPKRDKPTLNPS